MPLGFSLLRPTWARLNHLKTSVSLFCSEKHKWDMAPTAACKCGAKEHTPEHVTTSCPIYHHPNGACTPSDVNKNLEKCQAILWTIQLPSISTKQRKRLLLKDENQKVQDKTNSSQDIFYI